MSLREQVDQIEQEATAALRAAKTEAELFQVKARFLGKKGSLSELLKQIPTLPPEERKPFGAEVNRAKIAVEAVLEERQAALRRAALASPLEKPLDVSLPGRRAWRGSLHPITLAWNEINDIFTSMGFTIEEGPEVETDWHNFEALNMPAGHPAREMQDTFYVAASSTAGGSSAGGALKGATGEADVVLRTHTSPVQARTMLRRDPPLRVICPGPVYRRDNDPTHTPMFHQVEGLVVDERTTMADLKGTLAEFARAFFGPSAKVRFRSSFFPFTEPSAEVDISCPFPHGGAPCRVCKDTGWLEVLGCGMVDPAVFTAIGRPEYDPARVQGFAFGMGIDRLAMLRYGIPDLRLLFENDLRLLEQFPC